MYKVLYVTTLLSHVALFHMPHIKMLQEKGIVVDVVGNDDLKGKENLSLKEVERVINIPFSRKPISFSNMRAYNQLKEILKTNHYDIIFCDTPVAGVLCRMCCKSLRREGVKVVYMAHGFHFYKGAPAKNWIMYYNIEKALSKNTDVLITINDEDFKRAQDKIKTRDIEYIAGIGVDINKIDSVKADRSKVFAKFGIASDAKVILSVGEVNDNKNHELVVRALSQIKDKNFYYLIAGEGPLDEYLEKLARKLGVADKVKLIGYRSDVLKIYKSCDIYCHPSLREGLPVSLMEAMVCKLPVVVTNIRGNKDLIDNEKGGFIIEPNDIDSFAIAIATLLDDEQLRKQFGEYNRQKVQKNDLEIVKEQFGKIIDGLLPKKA